MAKDREFNENDVESVLEADRGFDELLDELRNMNEGKEDVGKESVDNDRGDVETENSDIENDYWNDCAYDSVD